MSNINTGAGSLAAMHATGIAGGGTNGISGGYGGTVFPGLGSLYIGGTTLGPLTPQQQQELKDAYDKIAQISGAALTFPMPPTQEELVELDALEQLRQSSMKQQQVDAFKKVPASLRQRIVDDILWTRELASIETIDTSKSARQLELESKKSTTHGSLVYGGGTGSGGSAGYTIVGGTTISSFPYATPSPRPLLPSLMSDEDVIQAHNDATMAEECLNQD